MPSASTAPRIAIACECGFRARVAEEHAGKKMKCKGCGARLVVGEAPASRTKQERATKPEPAKAAKPAPALVRSEKNILVGAAMSAWGLGSALYGVKLVDGGGAYSIGMLVGALASGLVLLPVGLKTIAVGAQRSHVPEQDALYPGAKLIIGGVALLGGALNAMEAVAALPSADGNGPAVVLAISALVGLAGGALVSSGVRALRAASAEAEAGSTA